MKVKVIPLTKQTALTNISDKSVYPNVSRCLSPVFNKEGKIKTGLTKEDEERLGLELGLDVSNKSTFWHDFYIRLSDKEVTFDLEDPYDELRIKFLSTHPEVAPSFDKINGYHSYVIDNEAEEAKKKAKSFDAIIEAYKHIAEMSVTERRDFLKLFGVTKTNELVDDSVKGKLKELADLDPVKFCAFYEDKNKDMKILIEDLVTYNILRKNGAAYVYNEDVLGGNLELTIAYLKENKNQPTLIALKKQLVEKRKAFN
jgi:hypothetical protein